LNQNGAPAATCPGVQMNCLVIMNAGFCPATTVAAVGAQIAPLLIA
jgi:hypothetical protein